MCGILVIEGKTDCRRLRFSKLKHRGPDNSKFISTKGDGTMNIGFHRLSIQDLSDNGNQPFYENGNWLVCNGEIYNYDHMKKWTDGVPTSGSDCEILLFVYEELGIEGLVRELDAEFALVIISGNTLVAARDPIGIRPLFYGYDHDEKIAFASEVKALTKWCDEIFPFPPGHYYDDGKFVRYSNIVDSYAPKMTEKVAILGIKEKLQSAVSKRLCSDAPIGYLLSGGLDSSLVCAIAARESEDPITTFAIGIDKNPIDIHYARIVAKHIGSNHHEVLFSEEDVLNTLDELIYHLETWDITTIRAAMGMYLVCKYVWEQTEVKVVMTGEVSDELFGYKYTDFSPSPEEFQKEAIKRVNEIYIYDVLRADRSISAWGLEARVPFGDKDFVEHVMSIPPELKMNKNGIGKRLLREAFEGWLPDEILYREKAAFSDAVGHRLVDYLKEMAEDRYDDLSGADKYDHGKPFTKESLMYREIFEKHFPGRGKLIKDFWMPNKSWAGCDVNDPSARVLSNYGVSGK